MNTGPNTVSVLGVRVSGINKAGLLNLVQEWATQGKIRTLLYVNAYCLNMACTDVLYRNILNQADLVYPDGIGVVWAGRWLSCVRLEKLTGWVWLPDVCKLAVAQNWGIYLLGGKLSVAAQAGEIIKNRYPGLRLLGAADGYFMSKSEADVLQEITALKPHILFVGMGAPRQEKWCALHRTAISAPIVWTVGALFDTVTGIEPLAPPWFNALALEWLWRLLRDPRGKWRRYIIGNPQFLWRVFHQKYLEG